MQGGKLCFSYRGTAFSLPTLAHYQKSNAIAVIEAYRALLRQGLRLEPAHLEQAFAAFSAPLSVRFVSLSPAWVIDAADSPLRLSALVDSIDRLPDLFGDGVAVWTEPTLEAAVRDAFGERLFHVETIETSAFRRMRKALPLPKDSPLVIVGSKPFAAEALSALEAHFLYS